MAVHGLQSKRCIDNHCRMAFIFKAARKECTCEKIVFESVSNGREVARDAKLLVCCAIFERESP